MHESLRQFSHVASHPGVKLWPTPSPPALDDTHQKLCHRGLTKKIHVRHPSPFGRNHDVWMSNAEHDHGHFLCLHQDQRNQHPTTAERRMRSRSQECSRRAPKVPTSVSRVKGTLFTTRENHHGSCLSCQTGMPIALSINSVCGTSTLHDARISDSFHAARILGPKRCS